MVLLSRLQKEEKLAAQCSSSQGSSSKAPWDNPFHRAVNKVMERPVLQLPHRSHIVGEGLGHRPSQYFPESKEDRAKRKQQEDTDVKSQLAKMPEMINDTVTKTVVALLPHLLTAYTEWVDGGKIGPSPLASFTESSSLNISDLVQKNARVMESPPAASNPSAGTRDDESPSCTVPHSSPSVACTPVRGPSTLAELDAITVYKRHNPQQVTFSLACIHFLTPYTCLRRRTKWDAPSS
jgi:hypothetical protein